MERAEPGETASWSTESEGPPGPGLKPAMSPACFAPQVLTACLLTDYRPASCSQNGGEKFASNLKVAILMIYLL